MTLPNVESRERKREDIKKRAEHESIKTHLPFNNEAIKIKSMLGLLMIETGGHRSRDEKAQEGRKKKSVIQDLGRGRCEILLYIYFFWFLNVLTRFFFNSIVCVSDTCSKPLSKNTNQSRKDTKLNTSTSNASKHNTL